MKEWQIPAKTFFLGEYAALEQAPAIVLCTQPCFSVYLDKSSQEQSLHPASPAARLLQDAHIASTLRLTDPYQKKGGLGASTAEFIGAYLAVQHLKNEEASLNHLLESYYQFSWQGVGRRPSGYDLIAQFLRQSVYINRRENYIEALDWTFPDLNFILIRSGKKLATHEHLKNQSLRFRTSLLEKIVLDAREAFARNDSQRLIDTVNQYHRALLEMNLVAQHSLEMIETVRENSNVLAAKGCGALGADIILLLCKKDSSADLIEALNQKNITVIATATDIHFDNTLNKDKKIISIS